jgi:tRNA-Thr(GGU) m(6)t(6)A37 methyltransferase TsaA
MTDTVTFHAHGAIASSVLKGSSEMDMTYRPIGIIHSPFTSLEAMPIQPVGATSGQGIVEIFAEFADGLKDLDGFSYLILLYHFHKAHRSALTVTPFLDSTPHGIFATRAPTRPNPIGLSVVKLLNIKDNAMQVEQLDILDETPVLDIKPYVPEFDHRANARIGWLERVKEEVSGMLSDDRFA